LSGIREGVRARALTPLTRHRDALAIGLLLFAQVVVLLLDRPNPRWNDGVFMLDDARDFPDIPADHFSLRIGLLLPTKLAEAVLGYGQVSYYAVPLVASLLLVVVTYVVGKQLAGRLAGVLAGALIIVCPILVETEQVLGAERMTTWQLLPDIPSTALFVTGLAFLLRGLGRRNDADADAKAASPAWFVVAGVCFGWAYLVREFVPFLFPLIALVLLLWRARWRSWAQVAGGMLACLALELALSAAVHGDPFVRFRLGAEHGGTPPSPITRTTAAEHFWHILGQYQQTAIWSAALIVTLVAPLVFRRREHVVPAAWFACYWGLITAVSGGIDPHRISLNSGLARYWIPVLPAIALGTGAAVAAVVRTAAERSSRAWILRSLAPVAAAVVIALFALPIAGTILDNPRDAAWNGVRSWLSKHDADVNVVVTDDRDARTLSIYEFRPIGGERAWHARVDAVPHSSTTVPTPAEAGADVLLWSRQLSRRPPGGSSGWRLVYRRGQVRLYLADRAPSPSDVGH
jgi:hypothetical protein